MDALLFFTFFLFMYFLPAFVANQRGHHQATAILVLTFLFGWTGIGWGVAMIWACTAIPAPSVAAPYLALPQ